MSTLQDLNTFSDGTVTFTENRPSDVFFSFPTAVDLTNQEITTQTFTLQRTTDIVEIIQPSLTQITFEVDVSSLAGTTVTFPSMPSGVTNSDTAGVYTISGIDSVSDWDAVKAPTITLPSADHQGSFQYTCTISYTSNGVRKTQQWTVGTFKALAQLSATSSLSFTADSLIKGATSHMIAAITITDFTYELVILGRFSVNVTATTLLQGNATLLVTPTINALAFKYPSFNIMKGYTRDTLYSRIGEQNLFGGKYGVGWSLDNSSGVQMINATGHDSLNSTYAGATGGSQITNGILDLSSVSGGGTASLTFDEPTVGAGQSSPNNMVGFVNLSTSASTFYHGAILGARSGRFAIAQWTGPNNPTQLNGDLYSDDFGINAGDNQVALINTATSQIIRQIKGVGISGSGASGTAVKVVDYIGTTFSWDSSINSTFSFTTSDYTGMTSFEAVASCFEYYAAVGDISGGSRIVIRDASDGSAVTTIDVGSNKTFNRMAINSQYVAVMNTVGNSGTMVFRISDGATMMTNTTNGHTISMSDLFLATAPAPTITTNSTVTVYRIPEFVVHTSKTNPNVETSSSNDYFGAKLLATDDYLYVSAYDEDFQDGDTFQENVGVIYRFE